jgi:hypothetical protein
MLLPWYATGRLDRADMARVESYLARHPQLARQLDLVRDEQAQAVAANEALGWPSAGAADRLMARLPAAPRGGSRRAGAPLFQAVREFFAAPTAGGVRWAAAGVAALLAVQTAAIATLLLSDRGGTYQLASGRQSGAAGISALVGFTDAATAPAISRLLAEFDASIVDGPKPGGLYRIRLRTEDRSQAEARLRLLEERRDIVRVVLRSRD